MIRRIMKATEIIQEIDRKVGSTEYKIWTIGITEDPTQRKSQHDNEGKDIKYWQDWKADNETIARSVEEYFLKKGMKGGTGGGEHPTYVYVF